MTFSLDDVFTETKAATEQATEAIISSPKRVLVISANSVTNFQNCEYKYYLSKERGLATLSKSSGLEKGDLIHAGLAMHYRNFLDSTESPLSLPELIPQVEKLILDEAINTDLETKDQLDVTKAYREYTLFYEADTWKPIEVETPFTKVLFDSDELMIVVEGIIDLVVDVPKFGLLPVDHKSSSRRPNKKHRGLTNQFRIYMWGSGTVSLCFNSIGFQKTLPPEEKYERFIISYPQVVIDDWIKNELIPWALRIDEALQTGTFLRNFSSCDGKYGMCEYSIICDGLKEDRERKMTRGFTTRERSSIYEKSK